MLGKVALVAAGTIGGGILGFYVQDRIARARAERREAYIVAEVARRQAQTGVEGAGVVPRPGIAGDTDAGK